MPDLLDRQLLYVTGKGGVGKTTVALAAALASAARGRRTIIAEVSGQQRISRIFGRSAQLGEEVELRDGLFCLSIDPVIALEHFVAQQLHSRALTQVLTRSNVFRSFVEAAPGARELITIGAVWDLVQERRWSRRLESYDTVIVDAPASGHGVGMLHTPRTFGDIARVGPLAQQAYAIAEWLRDGDRVGYAAVALAQEMPVAETIELGRTLHHTLGRPLEAVIVNAVVPPRFSDEEQRAVAALPGDELPARVARAVVASHAAHVRSQQEQLRRLRDEVDARVGTLPFVVTAALELEDIEALSERVGQELSAPPSVQPV